MGEKEKKSEIRTVKSSERDFTKKKKEGWIPNHEMTATELTEARSLLLSLKRRLKGSK